MVEIDKIAELKLCLDRSIDRMQQSHDIATATLDDVRAVVQELSAKGTSSPGLLRGATRRQSRRRDEKAPSLHPLDQAGQRRLDSRRPRHTDAGEDRRNCGQSCTLGGVGAWGWLGPRTISKMLRGTEQRLAGWPPSPNLSYLPVNLPFGSISGVQVKASSIKKYLRPSTIMSRKSTFASAFASALAPHDVFSPELVHAAVRDLGQDPDADLKCVYCGRDAATWDHVFNRVTKGEFSGHGHRVRNLVPCCRTCNESKGQKPWLAYLEALDPPDKQARIDRMEKFLSSADAQPIGTEAMRHKAGQELERFLEIRSQVFELMTEADRLAVAIRQKASY